MSYLRSADIMELGTDELEELREEAEGLEKEYRILRQLIESELRNRYQQEWIDLVNSQ